MVHDDLGNRMKKNEADLPKAFLIAIFVFIILIAEQYHLPPIFVVIFLLLLVLFIKIFSKPLEELLDNYEKKSKEKEALNDYDGTIKKYLPEIKGEKFLLDVLYTRFVLVESALNKGDFDTIKELCTDSLYDILYSKWKNYSTKKEKRTREKMKVHSYNIQT